MNILNIAESGMCIGCGACESVCPHKAIKMSYKPDGSLFARLDESKCTSCGLCNKLCPSSPDRKIGFDEDEIFYKNLGNKAYVAYASDEEIRKCGQSGGALTAILKYLFDTQAIHAVALNKYDSAQGSFVSYVAKSADDALSCTGSNYIQVPHCKTVIDNYDCVDAAVLLGCQAETLANYEKHCKNLKLNYRFGLICAGAYKKTLAGEFSEDFKKDEIDQFRFRDKRVNGVPGDTALHKANGQTVTFSRTKRVQAFKLYKCMRCMACNLKLNNSSDLLFGDPWGVSLDDPDSGYTVVVSQTEKGDKLLREIQSHGGYLNLKPIPVDLVVNGQYMKYYKKQFYNVYHHLKQKGMLIPYSLDGDGLPFVAQTDSSFGESVDYAYKTYNCQTCENAKLLVSRRKKYIKRKNKMELIKAQLKRPIVKVKGLFINKDAKEAM